MFAQKLRVALVAGGVEIPAPKAWTFLMVLMLAVSGAFLFYPRHAMIGLGAHLFLLAFIWAFFFLWIARCGRELDPVPLAVVEGKGEALESLVPGQRQAGR